MHSTLFLSRNPAVPQEFIQQLQHTEHIHPVDTYSLFLESTDEKKHSSIGIAQVKQFCQKLYYKPLQSPQKLAVIFNAEKLTQEAQNALLKILEEPPKDTIMVLCASSKETLLPTIISRTTIIYAPTDQKALEKNIHEHYHSYYQQLQHPSVGYIFSLAQQFGTKKEDALTFAEEFTHYCRTLTYQNPSSLHLLKLLQLLQDAYTTLSSTNVSPRLILEHTFLQLLPLNKSKNL